MRSIVIILFVLIAATSTAQKIPSDQRTVGDEIKIASTNYYIGFGIMLAGGLVIAATSHLQVDNAQYDTDPTGIYIGAGIATAGFVFIAIATSHIKKAGVKLNMSEKHALKIETSRDGVTLAMTF
ncbi:MAG: hypothetical protein V2I47_03995 [Bacteroidales bacterium]|jgi:hypothetical protein|nr:hypothetical protein [Bacteroidales bacterium]